MTNTPRAAPRTEVGELAELRRLKALRPELAEAVNLHLALLDLQRRVQARAALPWIQIGPERLRAQREAGLPLLRFEDVPLDWSDFRLVFRQTADVLLRFEALDRDQHRAILAVARDGHELEPLVEQWFDAAAAPDRRYDVRARSAPLPREAFDQVVALAMRPFLERTADLVQQHADFASWNRPICPVCGGEPEFAVLRAAGDRLLICGRCTARWPFDDATCPFCRNADRALLPSFGSADGVYRLYACDRCRRYLKAYDARRGGRPVMLAVDSVATLPLDAAAIQRGYGG